MTPAARIQIAVLLRAAADTLRAPDFPAGPVSGAVAFAGLWITLGFRVLRAALML